MDKNNNFNKFKENNQQNQEKKPNEHGGFYFSSFLKITDPKTNEVLVQKRGDY